MPTFGSLFAGIGGFDLGLERAGWTCRWQVERDRFCLRVLAKHWPDVARYGGDIATVDPGGLEPVDLICGGFPCQPVSVAGKRLAQADERWLWPEFARFVRALRPRYVLVENVPGLLVRGLGDVVGDLAACGYDSEWDCIPAAAVGAPHIRDRVWIVGIRREWIPSGAVSDAKRLTLRQQRQRDGEQRGESRATELGDDGSPQPLADAEVVTERSGLRADESQGQRGRRSRDRGGASSQQPPALADADGGGCGELGIEESAGLEGASGGELDGRSAFRGLDGRAFAVADQWLSEPDVGRVVDGLPARLERTIPRLRLRALGNAVVPQVAEWLGRRLLEVHQCTS